MGHNILRNGLHIETLINVVLARRYSHTDQQPFTATRQLFILERVSNLLDQFGIAFLVLWIAAIAEGWILPIKVNAIKVVFTQKFKSTLDECQS